MHRACAECRVIRPLRTLHPAEQSSSDPSRQSDMVQPVVQEMFATVHAAGSSLLARFIRFTCFIHAQPSIRHIAVVVPFCALWFAVQLYVHARCGLWSTNSQSKN
eukprot:scaffold230_cov150-Isochrysis_galbana.AAC.3